ncbi:MAG: YbaB/EbfC family nucleoid-associated protein [Magnetococcus sp. WYHC-3]
MVEATVNGQHEVKSIRIDPKMVAAGDVEMLEDLVVAAINDAQNRMKEESQKRLSKVTGGFNIPGLNLPF